MSIGWLRAFWAVYNNGMSLPGLPIAASAPEPSSLKNGLRGAFSAASLTMLITSVPGMTLLILMLLGLALPALLILGGLLLIQLPFYWACKQLNSALKNGHGMTTRCAR
jgi:hypothetical protein